MPLGLVQIYGRRHVVSEWSHL